MHNGFRLCKIFRMILFITTQHESYKMAISFMSEFIQTLAIHVPVIFLQVEALWRIWPSTVRKRLFSSLKSSILMGSIFREQVAQKTFHFRKLLPSLKKVVSRRSEKRSVTSWVSCLLWMLLPWKRLLKKILDEYSCFQDPSSRPSFLFRFSTSQRT